MVKQLSIRSYRASQSQQQQPSRLNHRREQQSLHNNNINNNNNNNNKSTSQQQQQQQKQPESSSLSSSALASSSSLVLSQPKSCCRTTTTTTPLRCSLFRFGALIVLIASTIFLVGQQQYRLVKYVKEQDEKNNNLGIMPIALDLENLLLSGNLKKNQQQQQKDDSNKHKHNNNNNNKYNNNNNLETDPLDLDRFESLIAQSDRISKSQKELLSQAILALQDGKQRVKKKQKASLDDEDDKKLQEIIRAKVSIGDDAIPQVPSNSPYAYMFVIGGIHEDRPSYKGFLYDVLVATHLFRRQLQSTADIWLYTQMSPDSTMEMLPTEELQQLQTMNIHVHQLPKAEHETFTHLVFSKFRGLQMTQYRRVTFVDADIIPLANLDYLFHLSDPLHTTTPTILQPNLIMASRGEPCNAGVFMLQPEHGGWDHLWQIVDRQRKEGAALPYPHFSWERGWGHDFGKENDSWRSTNMYGKRWRFHAGHSDQGLLYYWVKYVKQHASLVIKDEIENWIPDPKGSSKPFLSNTLYNQTLLQYTSKEPLVYQMSCDREMKFKSMDKLALQCVVPYRDFSHFMGNQKPWEKDNPRQHRDPNKAMITNEYVGSTKLFFDTLDVLNDELNLGLNFDQWHIDHLPQLKNNSIGRMSMMKEIALDVMKLKNMTRDEYDIWQGFKNATTTTTTATTDQA